MADPRSESAGVPAHELAVVEHAEEHLRRAPGRAVTAGAFLAVIGSLGVFLPFAGVAWIAPLVSHGPMGLEGLTSLANVVIYVPAVCLLALSAAYGLYNGTRWGRPLGLLIAAALVASPAIWFVATQSSAIGDDLGPAGMAIWHLFLVVPHQVPTAAAGAVVGAIVAWGLLTRPRLEAGQGSGPIRRPSLALFLLVIVAVESLVPYVNWIAANLLAAPVSANGVTPGSAAQTPQVGAGVLLAIPTALATISALAAARAIRLRAAYGPYLAPVAAAMAGPWAALWVFLIGFGFLSSADEGAIPAPVGLAVTAVTIAVSGLAGLSFFIVTATVLRRRDWFEPPRHVARAGGARSIPRFWRVTASITALLLVPLAIGAVIAVVNPPPPSLSYGEVLFEGRVYDHVAPLDVDEAVLAPTGHLSAWTEGLTVSPDSPDAFSIAAVAVDRAIVVRGGVEGSTRRFSLFIAHDASSPDGSVPMAVCPYVALEDPSVFVDPCGPPHVITLGGIAFEVIDEVGFEVAASDLESLGEVVLAAAPPDPRVDLTAHAIDGVDPADAIALRIGERIVLYRAGGRFVGQLCFYSPGAVQQPLGEEKFGDAYVPEGCGFPGLVALGERLYGRHGYADQLLDVPASHLVRPLGQAAAFDDRVGRQPFPPTIDATAYAISGVDPGDAIAFIVGDQVVVLRPADLDAYPLPAGLCPYARPEVVAEFESQGDQVGC